MPKNDRKPRLLLVVPLPPPVHGAATVSQSLRDSEPLAERFDCDFVNLSTSRSTTEIGRNDLRKLFRFCQSWFRLLGLLLRRRYALCCIAVTVGRPGLFKDLPFVLLCRLFGRRVVLHQHNKGVAETRTRKIYDIAYRMLYRKARVILLSWQLYPDIEPYVDRKNVAICPNGIPEQPPYTTRSPHENETPHLFSLANLALSKGILQLLDACAELGKRGRHFVCELAGGESEEMSEQRLKNEIAQRELTGTVVYLGRVYGAEKTALFHRAALLVAPTYDDCFPLVHLEAMQQGLPIISTFTGGIPDIVENGVTGLLVPPKQTGPLTEAIDMLLNDPALRQRMGEAGREKFEKEFTLEAFEKRFIDCMERFISEA